MSSCNRIVAWAMFASALLLATAPARAALRLRIEDVTLGSGAVITDNGPGDINPTAGIISFSGAVSANFTINVTTGTSDPPVGPAGVKSLELNSVDVASTGAGTLRILLENDGYTGPAGPGTFSATLTGGLTAPSGGSITAQSWVNPSNLSPALGPDQSPPGPLVGLGAIPPGSVGAFAGSGFTSGPGAFSPPTSSAAFTAGALDSMFTEMTVQFTGPGSVSFDLASSFTSSGSASVPLPPAILPGAISALGCIGIGWRRARRRRGVAVARAVGSAA